MLKPGTGARIFNSGGRLKMYSLDMKHDKDIVKTFACPDAICFCKHILYSSGISYCAMCRSQRKAFVIVDCRKVLEKTRLLFLETIGVCFGRPILRTDVSCGSMIIFHETKFVWIWYMKLVHWLRWYHNIDALEMRLSYKSWNLSDASRYLKWFSKTHQQWITSFQHS